MFNLRYNWNLVFIKLNAAVPKLKFFTDEDFLTFCFHFKLGFLSPLKREEWLEIMLFFSYFLECL